MQLHKFIDPIFKRLNTELVTRNLAHEDYGALQSALGFQSIYGDDIDMIIWDGESESRPVSDLNRFIFCIVKQILSHSFITLNITFLYIFLIL